MNNAPGIAKPVDYILITQSGAVLYSWSGTNQPVSNKWNKKDWEGEKKRIKIEYMIRRQCNNMSSLRCNGISENVVAASGGWCRCRIVGIVGLPLLTTGFHDRPDSFRSQANPFWQCKKGCNTAGLGSFSVSFISHCPSFSFGSYFKNTWHSLLDPARRRHHTWASISL